MDDIRGLKPYLFFSPNWKLLGLVALAILAVAAAAWWLSRRKPAVVTAPEAVAPARPVAPPRSVAGQLDALEAEGLVAGRRFGEFHARLSALMRAYLGARFGMPARRYTTTELLAALTRFDAPAEVQRVAASLLLQCDLVKFAEARPTADDANARLAEARALLASLGDLETAPEEALEAPEPDAAPESAPPQEGRVDVVG